MSLNDPLANVLSKLSNATKIGKFEVIVDNNSKLIRKVLSIMNDANYIQEIQEIKDSKGDFLKITLSGNLNNCGVIKPRFAVKIEDYEKFEKRFLLAKNFGFLLVSTNQGLMTHKEAKDKKLGGKLISFCY